MIIAGHQQITKEWWATRRVAFDIFISQIVIDEINLGDAKAAAERWQAIEGLQSLEITPEVDELIEAIMSTGYIPPKAAADAAQIAIASVHKIDFLLTWNCRHIANAVIAREVARTCKKHGYECPGICTSEELLSV